MTTEEMIKFLQARIDHLEQMLEQSMEMNRKLMERISERPITPLPYPLPSTQPIWPTVPKNPEYNLCPKCGLKLEGVMGYVCPQAQCPTGLGGAWCTSGSIT